MTSKTTAPLVKLVIFAVVTLLLTGMLAQTLGAFPSAGVTYRARFTDVTGLLVGDDVRIAGVRVGRVKQISVVDDTIAEVAFTVTDDVPLATSVRAKIRYRNLVGQRYVALTEGPGDGRPLRENGLIPLAQTTPALDLTVLFNGFRPLFTALNPDDVNKLAYQIVQVLQGEGGTVASLLSNVASLTNTLANRDAVIGRVVTNLNSVLTTLATRDRNLDQTIGQLQKFVSGLAVDRKAIGESLVSIGELTTATAGLLGEVRPPLAADVRALDELAGTLDRNAAVIDATLGRLPGRYDALTRVASSGSWFNFYLCDFNGHVAVAGHAPIDTPTFSAPAARCSTGGSR
ncbi:phospholipid/cholesterol/gamma-HCH transport system substrate-binding protein [Micromonospora pallida]|uniref:Phospholipid/cholesterol/gamma-HCH transport system substrate-binding protein n=1 Tax=Micromonospora pallida TaxID=145854 RepID=A0A1C6SDW6_9ACTN|nr:MCE family protein [Micromonospora pallida]SCL27655.1 phospholipid/cholesterol/gamma-HCH transport system substrate-binding protein [Micromonospora pallida]